MAKIKFTKTELKKQQDAKKQFERFLPTLQLKKQQLQMEVRHSMELLADNARRLEDFERNLAGMTSLFGPEADAKFVFSAVAVEHVRRGELNIAGITVPTFEGVDFKPVRIDLLTTDWYVDDAVAAVKSAVELREAKLEGFVELFGPEADAEFVRSLVAVDRVRRGELNIAGIVVPTFEGVEFKPVKIDLLATDWYVDDAVAALKEAVNLRESRRVLEERCALLTAELRSTSQRVNLFEKVKIPECKENIRRIGIMLGDANTSAVARCKIAKRKATSAA